MYGTEQINLYVNLNVTLVNNGVSFEIKIFA